jgi:hypothetical protein
MITPQILTSHMIDTTPFVYYLPAFIYATVYVAKRLIPSPISTPVIKQYVLWEFKCIPSQKLRKDIVDSQIVLEKYRGGNPIAPTIG